MIFVEQAGPQGPALLDKDHENEEPEPRGGVNVCERSEQPAKAGVTLTPSTNQAQRTRKASNFEA